MNIINTIRGWVHMLLGSKAKEEFNITPIQSAPVDALMQRCAAVYQGSPDWVDADDHITTINFAKSVCSETARLATLAIGIKIDGSARAKWLQEQIDKIYFELRNWVEYGCGYGTVILKPNGDSVELYTRGNYEITHQTGGVPDGAVFMDTDGDYTRMEYHRFTDDGLYVVTNRCFKNDKPVSIEKTPWADLEEEMTMSGIEKPLFAVLRMPHANNLDTSSPYTFSIFSDALNELKDLDIAYSRNAKEIKDSKRTVLLDSDKLLESGRKVNNTAAGFNAKREQMGLPDYVKCVYGSGGDKPFYEEINPTLQTDARLTGINALLSQIGYKVGFSNGYFVFNERTGLATATQVESDDRRTIQFIKDVRDKLESCMDDLIYALDKFSDLYDYAPVGVYEVTYDFGDITYSREEDVARWWGYVQSGKVPAWRFFVKFEGMSEEEAKAMEEEATPKQPLLFGGEE